MAGMTRDADADFITPGDYLKERLKPTLFPWYVYPPVEPFVARMLAGTVGMNGNTFFVVDLTMSITVPVSHLTGWQPHYAAGL